MTNRVGVQHETAYKSQYAEGGEFPACTTIRIEVSDVPVLGRVRFDVSEVTMDLAAFNLEMQRKIAKAIAWGFDYGVMAARANPQAEFINEGSERIFQTLHSDNPETHAARAQRSTKAWAEDCERGSVEWVQGDLDTLV